MRDEIQVSNKALLDTAKQNYARAEELEIICRNQDGELTRLRDENARLREALRAVQWCGRCRFKCIECDGQPATGQIAASGRISVKARYLDQSRETGQ